MMSCRAAFPFYDDLEGHWAADILNELARYNVGWQGGKAEADPVTRPSPWARAA